MNKFQKITALASVIHEMKKHEIDSIDYIGTIKLHGANTSWSQFSASSEVISRSRNRELSLKDDSYGFSSFSERVITQESLRKYFMKIRKYFDIDDSIEIIVYGEWIGRGVQHGVGVSDIEKMFVIFATRVYGHVGKLGTEGDNNEGGVWVEESLVRLENDRVKYIKDFKTFKVNLKIDSESDLRNLQTKLEEITISIENECPFYKQLSEKIGTGEGVVWRPEDFSLETKYWFKTKGEKHSVRKQKRVVEIDPIVLKSLKDLCERVFTDNRREQIFKEVSENVSDVSMSSTYLFMRLLSEDVDSEERVAIEESGHGIKDLMKFYQKNNLNWWKSRLNTYYLK